MDLISTKIRWLQYSRIHLNPYCTVKYVTKVVCLRYLFTGVFVFIVLHHFVNPSLLSKLIHNTKSLLNFKCINLKSINYVIVKRIV